jgi:hypothetical protein
MAIGPPEVRPEASPWAKVDQVPSTQKESASMEIMENFRVRVAGSMWPGWEGDMLRGEREGSSGLLSDLSIIAVVVLYCDGVWDESKAFKQPAEKQ